ncbi:uncharacterized protein [Neodiprion pinetum]|uniref:uncharacterized protein isoform X2 n=1 Tax=Neodiprion pinetum TaxID=441929 RepID=UPI001EE0FB33|nr:uncharacterized protein LOC124224151 isoform X1 [Neodiprion pinetum]XP_046492515.1 uncharacterized protein LOC124224151 isoform X1 [Neodiprion pinetum]
MAIDIKFTKFDNTPWGFRLAGGSDFPQPLTVIRVTEGSLAECMGLRVGDIVVRLNDQPISSYTHGRAQEALVLAGNNFVLSVLRSEDSEKVIEAIQQENIVPYNIPLEELKPVYSPEVPEESVPEPCTTEFTESERMSESPEKVVDPDEEALMSKPMDANSEVVTNKNLTDEEIALLILEEEELLPEQGVLGVNFKKLRPRAALLKESKVLEELQKIETADPPQVQELKRSTTFLQKPQRPPPRPKTEAEQPKGEQYRVVIQKQKKKSFIERLTEKGLLGPIPSPEPPSQKTTPAPTPTATPEPPVCNSEEELSRPGSKADGMTEVIEEVTEVVEWGDCGEQDSVRTEEITCETRESEISIEQISVPKFDKEKMKELVTTELNLEKQLESVQSQLLALKQLPSEIETHLRIVSEQLYKIMELSGVSKDSLSSSRLVSEQNSEVTKEITEGDYSEQVEDEQSLMIDEEHHYEEIVDDIRENGVEENRDEDQSHGDEKPSAAPCEADDVPKIVEPAEEIEVKDDRVKKFVISYETQIIRSRDASPALSDRSFKPDPNLSPKDQLIQELQQKQGRKHSKDLWPQAKQVELTYGRRWRCPNDFFNDEMIAEVLSSQAEVLNGRALGINFKKYEKTNLPNYDHLMNSSAYKMIHKMEAEPQKGIPVRPAKVIAAEDILERVKSPTPSVIEDQTTERTTITDN